MNAAHHTAAHAPALLAELKLADRIIGAMLNAMTTQQKAKVHQQLDAAGVSGEGMTRANERLAVIEAATAILAGAGQSAKSQRMLDIESHAADVLSQAGHAAILLQALFDKLDQMGGAEPAVAAIDCFATCAARSVELMRAAADNIVALVQEGGAA